MRIDFFKIDKQVRKTDLRFNVGNDKIILGLETEVYGTERYHSNNLLSNTNTVIQTFTPVCKSSFFHL